MTHLIRRACYNTIWFEVGLFFFFSRMCIECKCTKKIFINDIYAHIMVGWFTIYLLATFSPSSVTPHYPITIGNTIIDPQKLCKPTSLMCMLVSRGAIWETIDFSDVHADCSSWSKLFKTFREKVFMKWTWFKKAQKTKKALDILIGELAATCPIKITVG